VGGFGLQLANAVSSWRPSPGYLAAALLLAVGAASLAFFLWYFGRPDAGVQPSQPAPASLAVVRPPPVGAPAPVLAAAGAQDASRPAPEGDADPTRDLRSYVMRGEKPTMNEVIKRLSQPNCQQF